MSHSNCAQLPLELVLPKLFLLRSKSPFDPNPITTNDFHRRQRENQCEFMSLNSNRRNLWCQNENVMPLMGGVLHWFSPVTHIFLNLNAKWWSVGPFLGPLETKGHTRLKAKPGNQSTEVQERLAKRLTVCRHPGEVGQCASLSGFDLRRCRGAPGVGRRFQFVFFPKQRELHPASVKMPRPDDVSL